MSHYESIPFDIEYCIKELLQIKISVNDLMSGTLMSNIQRNLHSYLPIKSIVRGFKQDGHEDCLEVEVYSYIQPLKKMCPHDALTGSSD